MKPIEVGDRVTVEYNDGTFPIEVYVRYVPQGPGDMWQLEYNTVLIYQNPLSSNLDAIIKKKDKEEEGGR